MFSSLFCLNAQFKDAVELVLLLTNVTFDRHRNNTANKGKCVMNT